MTAVVLSPAADSNPSTPTTTVGGWVETQDPESGATIKVWKEVDIDPVTPGTQKQVIQVLARGIITEGVSAAGATENWNPRGNYENIEYVKMTFGRNVELSQRDRITEIRDSSGRLVWQEESRGTATKFDVNGIIPIMDAFNSHIENVAYLKRSEVQ
jgi:hypothetical protein